MRCRSIFAGLIAFILAQTPLQAQTEQKSGYLIVSGWYKDAAVQRAYQPEMLKVIRQYDYEKAIVGLPGVNLRVLEGGWTPRFMLLARFPNQMRVKQFWWSDAYQEAREIRLDGAYLDVVTVQGLTGASPTMSTGNAYLVFLMHLKDREKFIKEYAPFAPAVVDKYSGKFIVRSGRENIELLEGNWPNQGIVVVQFPNTDALRNFWSSEEYRKLSEVRKLTGDWSVIEINDLSN
ncbi:hypothetical protein NRB_07190 [Novosphingobium sp. 11B]